MLTIVYSAVRDFVDEAVRHVLMKQGVLGIKVKIMHGWDPTGRAGKPFPLPDAVTILEPKAEREYTQPLSESKLAPPPAAAPVQEVPPQAYQQVAPIDTTAQPEALP